MMIKTLNLTSFGRFKDREVNLDEGINLIYGPNEAGKSTIQNFITGMLYGFLDYKGQNRRKYGPLQDRYKPWTGERYFGIMEYLVDGDTYRIERNFDNTLHDVKVYKNGRDITLSFEQNKQRERLFAQQHLGLGPRAFINTLSIGQLGSKTEDTLIDEVKTKLINMQNSGNQDLSIQRAKDALQRQLDSIGSLKASKKELGQIVVKIEELEGQLDRARQNRQRIDQLSQLRDESLNKLKRLRAVRASLKLDRINQYKDQQMRLKEKLEGFRLRNEIDVSQRDYLLDCKRQIELETIQKNQLEDTRKQLIQDSQSLEDSLEAYREYRNLRDEDITLYNLYRSNLDDLDREIAEVNGQLGDLEQVPSQDDMASALEKHLTSCKRLIKKRSRALIYSILSLGLGAALFLYSSSNPLFRVPSLGMLLPAVLFMIRCILLSKSIGQRSKTIDEAKGQMAALEGSRHAALDRESLYKRTLDGLLFKQNQLQASLSSITPRLPKTITQDYSFEAMDRLKNDFSSYKHMVAKLDEIMLKLEDLEGQIDRIKNRIAVKKEMIDSMLSPWDVDVEGYLKYCEAHENYLEYKRLQDMISQVTDNEDLGQLLKEAALGDIQGPGNSLSAAQLQLEIDGLSKDIIENEQQIRMLEAKYVDMAQLEEDLEILVEKRRTIEKQKKALEFALNKIIEVSNKIQREFAPQLNHEISNIMGLITEGRYTRVRIDEDLNVMTEVPETRQIKNVANLSSGTVDQFYLGLRIALAKMMAEGRQLPLMMDDSFVQYDDLRLKKAMEFLIVLGQQQQIMIFTCQNREKDILDSLGAKYNYIAL